MRYRYFFSAAFASLSLLAATVAVAATAFASDGPDYSNEPIIDPVPSKIAQITPFCVFDFSDPAAFDGWEAGPTTKLSRGNGVLVVDALDDDPYFFGPMLNELPSAKKDDGGFRTLRGSILVKIRFKHTTNGDGQIFSAETDARDYAENRSAHFTLAQNGEFNEYVVPLETSSPLLRLRFDPGGDKGRIEVSRVELYQVDREPLKFGPSRVEKNRLSFDLTVDPNAVAAGRAPIADFRYLGADAFKSYPGATLQIDGRGGTGEVYFPCAKPFEEIEIAGTVRDSGEKISRRFFAFHSDVADAQTADAVAAAPTLKSDSVAVRFAPDASGAEIFVDGKRAAVLCPLLCEEGDGAELIAEAPTLDAASTAADSAGAPETRLVPSFASLDAAANAIRFDVREVPVEDARGALSRHTPVPIDLADYPVRGSLKLTLTDDVLSFEVDAPRPVHSPVLRVLGAQSEAVLSGVEYLERGERSSSTADLETPEHIRFAPPALWLTAPFAAITNDVAKVGFLYDDPNARAIFAVPDFLDGDETSNRVDVCAKTVGGKIRFAPVDASANAARTERTVVDSILWAVEELGLPDLPARPRTSDEEEVLSLAAFNDSQLKMPGGWAHATGPGLATLPFDPHYGSDFLSTIWELTGTVPETPRFDVGGGHIRNYASFLVAGKAALMLEWLNNEAARIREQAEPNGAFRYSGEYLRGHWRDVESGYSGNLVFRLFEHWRLTGNRDSLEVALRGLDFANASFSVPRGAQVWELSLHTPDIMGASRLVLSNVLAFEATGDERYLSEARRWALTGIPFVYLWERKGLGGVDDSTMLCATTPVFGATNWISPNWIGLPVQWCGLDYAYALLLLAPYEKTLDWRKIGEGILITAERMRFPDGKYVGLLPDSFKLSEQERRPYHINPCAVHMLRRMLDGRPTNVSVVDVAGRRVVSPYPAKVADANAGTIEIAAKAGTKYQLVIDGAEIREIESNGIDVVSVEK